MDGSRRDFMKRVVIIGGGFGGLACARALSGCRTAEVTLLDKKETSDFLPVLPDIIGGRVAPDTARAPLGECAKRRRFRFVQDEVARVDTTGRLVHGQNHLYEYDHLVIAAGTQTNFYGDEAAARSAFKLDSVHDAERISAALREKSFGTIVVAGGGYTGIEVATNLRRLAQTRQLKFRIIIAEASRRILNALPEWIAHYAENNLAHMNVEIALNCRASPVADNQVELSNGQIFQSAMLIWAAGVRTPSFVREIGPTAEKQERLAVDGCLQVADGIYAVGDSAAVVAGGQSLRMAVQFAVAEGHLTGENIARSLNGKPMRAYRPRDMGYLVPMANHRACGLVLGQKLRGLPASLLHHAMCAAKSAGLRRKFRMLKEMF